MSSKLILTAFIVPTVAMLLALVWVLVLDAQEWDRFRAEHNCRSIASIRGDVLPVLGIGANGAVALGVGVTADKTVWQCDDGKTYYR